MTRRWIAGLLCLPLVAGCADRPLRPSARLPDIARESPQRYVVLTLRNPVTGPGSRAAATPRGYDGAGLYAAGLLARRQSRGLAADYHLRAVANWPIALLRVHCIVYALPDGADATALGATLAQDPRVESVQPLQTFATASGAYNDPYAALQRNVEQMSVPAAQILGRGANVRVAVIDTGADVGHPDLPTVRTRNFVDDDARAFRADAHGTAVAGIIAAVPNNRVGIVGIAPDVTLLIFKACWRASPVGIKAQCNSFTLALALAAAIEAHADLINLSLAGPPDPLLTRLVDQAVEAGIIVVGAVMPDGSRDSFPTNIGAVIAVDAAESGHDTAHVLYAPGRDVISLAPEGHYDFYSGSSLATAEVSGLVSLLRAQRPRLTAQDAELLLSQSAGRAASASRSAVPDACAALATLLRRGGEDCSNESHPREPQP